MYIETQQDFKRKRDQFRFVKAKDLQSQSLVMRTGTWVGREEETFMLPSVTVVDLRRSQGQMQETGPYGIPMDSWLKFFGVWLSDGWPSKREGEGFGSYSVAISQKKSIRREEIREMLDEFPIRLTDDGKQYYVYDKRLGQYLAQFGDAPRKFVPSFIKNLSTRQIMIFLDWFSKGDATQMANNFRIFYTSSKVLADDIQELLLKVGRVGLVKSRAREGRRWIVNHWADSSRMQYEVIERVRKINSWLDTRDMETVSYEGKVYCASVKNHVMYVRRNGKPLWCGNTSTFYTKDSPVFERTLQKAKDKLAASKYVGYVDINCIANSRGIWPLEWTCFDEATELLTRFGWKKYFEIEIGDEALSINPVTREIDWKRISGLLVKSYRGEMIHVGAKGKKHAALDALVTPDHNMLIERFGSLSFA